MQSIVAIALATYQEYNVIAAICQHQWCCHRNGVGSCCVTAAHSVSLLAAGAVAGPGWWLLPLSERVPLPAGPCNVLLLQLPIANEDECADYCMFTRGCSGWSFCSSTTGCGTGCKSYVAKTPSCKCRKSCVKQCNACCDALAPTKSGVILLHQL